jgi:hypothetical protein
MHNNYVCRETTPRRARVVQGRTTPFNYSRFLETPEGLVRNISVRIPRRVTSPNAQRPAQRPPPRRHHTAPAFVPRLSNNPARCIARGRGFRQTAAVVAQVREVQGERGARTSRTQRRRNARKFKTGVFGNNDQVRQRNAMREAAAAARRRALDIHRTSDNVSTVFFEPPRRIVDEVATVTRRRHKIPEIPSTDSFSSAPVEPPLQCVSPDQEYDPVETSIELVRVCERELAQQIERLKLEIGISGDESLPLPAEESFD